MLAMHTGQTETANSKAPLLFSSVILDLAKEMFFEFQ
jgi:hypothetical protein